jgi:hypothetical protein
MHEDTSSGGVVSEDELVRLTELFVKFEGATDPLSNHCRESESEFNSLIETIYLEKVRLAVSSITFSQFRSYTRNICRIRASKQVPPFPCV